MDVSEYPYFKLVLFTNKYRAVKNVSFVVRKKEGAYCFHISCLTENAPRPGYPYAVEL